jgi:tripeptidyl-peptidase-1
VKEERDTPGRQTTTITMLFGSLVAALASSTLILEAVASPVNTGARVKREIPATHNLHERHQPHWSRKWSKRSKLADDRILPMRIGLKQSNLEAGHNKLMEM